MKILIYIEKADRSNTSLKGSCVDIFRQADYRTIAKDVKQYCQGINTNSGNKVWFQAIVSELSTKKNELSYYDGSESWDEINNKYDAVVLSAANLISPRYSNQILFLTNEIKKCKIPLFVISIGAQADSYDELETLKDSLKDEVSAFVRAVYETRGEIACRGYFTKEVFDSICENSAEVVGCPSLFQNGMDLTIPTKKVAPDQLNPVFNGNYRPDCSYFRKHPESVYIDQETWFYPLYDEDTYINKTDERIIKDFIQRYGYDLTELFFHRQIKLFWDTADWRRFLLDHHYNYSIGSRIHGTIMSVLTGIPSVLCAVDSRTREMGEYYGIPILYPGTYEDKNLYDLYLSADYSTFNQTFREKYLQFSSFLKKHHLVDEINTENLFWNKQEPIPNQRLEELLNHVSETYKKQELFWHMRKIAGRVKKELLR